MTSTLVDVSVKRSPWAKRKKWLNRHSSQFPNLGVCVHCWIRRTCFSDFFVSSNKRHELKRFCKAKTWNGKPKLPTVMTDNALKGLLRSACNSPEVTGEC